MIRDDDEEEDLYIKYSHGAMECIEELERDPMDTSDESRVRVYSIENATIARGVMSETGG